MNQLESDSDPSVQAAVAEEVNKRMDKALQEIGDKYAKLELAQAEQAAKAAQADASRSDPASKSDTQAREEDNDSDSDAEFLDGLDDDPELLRIREARLAQMKAEHAQKNENLSKGHGQYREIVQDEFLPEVTGSKSVICHFYHKHFEKCKVMDKHLRLLCPHHIEAKFVTIDAEKAPFFIGKLQIQILPTVVMFTDGVAVGRITGYEGLADDLPDGKKDEWPTSRLAELLAASGVIEFKDIPGVTTSEDIIQETSSSSIRSGFHLKRYGNDDDS